MVARVFGAIEAGGTKFVCGIGSGPDDLRSIRIPTTSPGETVRAVVQYLRSEAGDALVSLGVASFGPVDLRPGSPTFGYITSTPKYGWQNFDLAGALARALNVPVGFDTDVNGAVLAEARWGAAEGLTDCLYLTVGTGIENGAIAGGRVIHGLLHPEMGHIRVPHNAALDPFPGGCPYHGDCLEGLASGPAIEARWGNPAELLAPDHEAWDLEARYLSLALATWVCTLSPQRIVLGGGVMMQASLFAKIRRELARLLNGYIEARELQDGLDAFVVPPSLGGRAGVLGALILAEQAALTKRAVAGRSADRP